MKDTLLFTAFDDAMAPLGELTAPLLLAYANRHGFDFRCYRHALTDLKYGIYWKGVLGGLQAFQEGYRRVIHLEADQLITNPSYVPPFISGFNVSRDWGADAVDDSHFSMCGWVAFADAAEVLEAAWGIAEDWVDKPFPEQGPMQYLRRHYPWVTPIIQVHPRRIFGAVPSEVHESVVEPWQPGDWCCHITMRPLNERITIAKTILQRTVQNT